MTLNQPPPMKISAYATDCNNLIEIHIMRNSIIDSRTLPLLTGSSVGAFDGFKISWMLISQLSVL